MLSDIVTKMFDNCHLILDYFEALALWLIEDRKFTDPEVAAARLEICRSCPLNVDNICQDCGCRVGERSWWNRFTSKIYFPSEHCPQEKW